MKVLVFLFSVLLRYNLFSLSDEHSDECLCADGAHTTQHNTTHSSLTNHSLNPEPFIHTSCSIDKSYLVDVVTKLYIATDSNPVDVRTYELCSDLVDVRTSYTVRTYVVCVRII
jgi:hypothetical protein